MSYYSTISDINDPNLSSQSGIHGITLPQKKSFSDKCLYQNLDIVASGASLADQPNSVSHDNLHFIGQESLVPKDESFNFMNSPFRVSDNDLLLFELDEKIEEFPKKEPEETGNEPSQISTRFKCVSPTEFKSPVPSNKMAKTTRSQSPSHGGESFPTHFGKHKKYSNVPVSKVSMEKSFPQRKKEKKKNLLSVISPNLNLVHDITTTLTQTFIKISFIDRITKQTLLIRIRCRNCKEEITEEDLLGLILIDEIQIKSNLNLNKENITVTAYSERLKEMHISMIYPASEKDISEHKKGFTVQIESKPSKRYTQYRKQQNEIDMTKSWIGKILCRDPVEQKNFISEIRVNNGDGHIILVSPISSRQHKIICVVDYISETICSLRDLESKHVTFLEKMKECIEREIQNNAELHIYRDCPIYIETEYPSKVHCLYFTISLTRNKNSFEISEIITRLRENTNYWKEIVLKVSLSSEDPRVALYKEAPNVLVD